MKSHREMKLKIYIRSLTFYHSIITCNEKFSSFFLPASLKVLSYIQSLPRRHILTSLAALKHQHGTKCVKY